MLSTIRCSVLLKLPTAAWPSSVLRAPAHPPPCTPLLRGSLQPYLNISGLHFASATCFECHICSAHLAASSVLALCAACQAGLCTLFKCMQRAVGLKVCESRQLMILCPLRTSLLVESERGRLCLGNAPADTSPGTGERSLSFAVVFSAERIYER